MRIRSLSFLAALVIAAALLPVAAAPAQEPAADAPGPIRAGYGEADSTWHVGASAGQYADKEYESSDTMSGLQGGEVDPHSHSLAAKNSYGVQSRLSYRAIVVEDAEGDQVAFVKSDSYLAMDYLQRRAGQILAANGSQVSYDEIFHMASHNHSSPYYMSPSWGVQLFQDVFDLRAFEYHARAMAEAIMNAEEVLGPARMGATKIEHKLFKGMIARRTVADDGSPAGYPLDFGDFGLDVLRFERLNGDPIAAMINWGQHPEGLDPYDLITGDFVAPLERFVERQTGAPLVFGQGDVGSAEAGPSHPELIPEGIPRRWSHAGHAQAERGAFLLAQDVSKAWDAIGNGNALVPFTSDFDVAAGNAWVPGPLSHPYPSVWNCKTRKHATGEIEGPGLPTCGDIVHEIHEFDGHPTLQQFYDTLKGLGVPLPDHIPGLGYAAVEENLRLHLQAFKLGEVILMSCACEAQVDLILNLESRTDKDLETLWDGFDWTTRLDCNQSEGGDWTCARTADDPAAPRATFANPLTFSDEAYRRMKAQVHNPADGWDNPDYVPFANSEPSNPEAIKGNFTHTQLSPELGYTLPIGVGHAGDYNGYTVSYREYMAYDHYRKALTSYGPHTADYMNTRLMKLAGELNDGDEDDTFDYDPWDEPRQLADEARQVAISTALGQASSKAYDAWEASRPDDEGPAEALTKPKDIERFDGTTFSWRGGSNAVDNPTVTVERCVASCDDDANAEWELFADQTGEVQTMLLFPKGVNGFFNTYQGNQEWIWTANFEAFDAFPVGIGSTPEGKYRFAVVEGKIRQDGRDVSYATAEEPLYSQPFHVSRWDGIQVIDLRVEESGSVSFDVPPIKYPQTYQSPFRYVKVEMERETGDGEIPDSEIKEFCMTCSFRPWATDGTVDTATVTVLRADGTTEQVPASRGENGRWHADTDLYEGDSAYVDRGGIVDTYGEINGERSGEVQGSRQRPSPSPSESEDPEPLVTEVAFTDRSDSAGQYSDQALIEGRLTEADGGEPISGAELVFEMVGADGPKAWTATTDDDGLASTTIDLTLAPGDYTLTVRYAGDATTLGAADVSSFTIEKEDSALGLAISGKGSKRRANADLADADSPSSAISGALIEFFADGQKFAEAATNENGRSSVDIPPRYRGGHHEFEGRFAGDDYYKSSSGSART